MNKSSNIQKYNHPATRQAGHRIATGQVPGVLDVPDVPGVLTVPLCFAPTTPTKQPPFIPAFTPASTLILAVILITSTLLAATLFAIIPLKQAHAAPDTVEIDWQFTSPKPGDVRDIHRSGPTGDGTGSPDLDMWYCAINFNQNVGYAAEGADDAFIKNNISLVSLQYADGTPVEGAETWNSSFPDQRTVIYISIAELLDPITDYQVVVEPGITSNTGAVSTERYVIPFSTSEYIVTNLGTFSFYVEKFMQVGIPIIVILVIAGAAVQIIRFRRNNQVD